MEFISFVVVQPILRFGSSVKLLAMTDLDIARSVTPQPIGRIAEKLGLNPDSLEPYGKTKAKIPLEAMREPQGQLVLVTAISPTPAGEGKTTVTVGLTDGLNRIGLRAAAALREPSLGPVFGIKGGAAGGGRSQVIPMEDINLHFTGDFAAVEKANNLLAALIDNDLQRKNRVGLDPRTIVWKRVMDMNDRALRNLVIGLGGKAGGVPRESGFNITAASEVMAILCMSRDLDDLRERFGRIYVGDTWDRQPIFARDLKAPDAMAILMRDAIKPNLVQTLEGNPAILHGGPFANIAQGTNSLIATRMALGYADWVVTEAGFGADLGAEKFLNLKSRAGGLQPSVAVLVATVRALKYHGGVGLAELGVPNAEAVAPKRQHGQAYRKPSVLRIARGGGHQRLCSRYARRAERHSECGRSIRGPGVAQRGMGPGRSRDRRPCPYRGGGVQGASPAEVYLRIDRPDGGKNPQNCDPDLWRRRCSLCASGQGGDEAHGRNRTRRPAGVHG